LEKTAIIVVGMPGAGKSEVSSFYKGQGIPMFRTGDVFREEVVRRVLELNVENSEMISRKLREEEGIDVAARRVMEKVGRLKEKVVCIEGPRDMDEIKFIASRANAVLVVVFADDATRFRRMKNRGQGARDPKTMKMFEWRDSKELGRGLGEVISTKKYRRYEIKNEGSIDELKAKAAKILGKVNG
jgi:dephospho-CoA kinase